MEAGGGSLWQELNMKDKKKLEEKENKAFKEEKEDLGMALYWCRSCGYYHQRTSRTGRRHRKYGAGIRKRRSRSWRF